MNDVPGAELLGWGFNIFGPYDDSGRTSRLFEVTGGKPWQDPLTKVDYLIPGNVSSPSSKADSTVTTYIFSQRSEVQEHFSSKASLETGLVTDFGAFSGSFNTAFSDVVDFSSEYSYGIVEANALEWELGLETESLEQLTSAVRADLASLPATYTDDARGLFFAFFDKYGTHYVSRVVTGGRLYYYAAVQKSFSSDEKQLKVSLEVEFDAVLYDVKASAEADWKKVSKDWWDSRSVRIEAIGGSPDALLSGVPNFDTNENDSFRSWVDSIKINPAPVDFTLRPVSTLFPITAQQAIEAAYRAYLGSNILTVETRSTIDYQPVDVGPHLPIVTMGTRIAPDYTPVYAYGFFAAVMKILDPANAKICYLNYYSIDLGTTDFNYIGMFDEMAREIKDATETLEDYILVVASFNWSYYAPPSNDFQGILRSVGAGSVLDDWITKSAGRAGSIGVNTNCTYSLVGKSGTSRIAAEAMGLPESYNTDAHTIMRVRFSEQGDVIRLNAG